MVMKFHSLSFRQVIQGHSQRIIDQDIANADTFCREAIIYLKL